MLENEIASDQGIIRITDFMPIRETTDHHLPEIIRIVEGLEGEVDVRSELSCALTTAAANRSCVN